MLRKTPGQTNGEIVASLASMRPQRNAAENQESDLRVYLGTVASMRPQRNAAEND